MPELPDITVYQEKLRERLTGCILNAVRIAHPFFLRSVSPTVDEIVGLTVQEILRMGKRIVLCLSDECYILIHLMIAGRLRWLPEKPALQRKLTLASFDFTSGSLVVTEAGTKRRASLHLVRGAANLEAFRPSGVEVLESDSTAFYNALRRRNHTLKRALTDPRIVSGVGNSYSDEILHRARLSPFKLTTKLSDDELKRLFEAARTTLTEWTDIQRINAGEDFPKKVTAFHPQMAVHGKFGKPCPRCGDPVQRIQYAENEANYCPTCQTGGKLLADRGLSRLLKKDWPATLEALEEMKSSLRLESD